MTQDQVIVMYVWYTGKSVRREPSQQTAKVKKSPLESPGMKSSPIKPELFTIND